MSYFSDDIRTIWNESEFPDNDIRTIVRIRMGGLGLPRDKGQGERYGRIPKHDFFQFAKYRTSVSILYRLVTSIKKYNTINKRE